MKTKEYWSTNDDFKGSEAQPDGIVMLEQIPPGCPEKLNTLKLHPDLVGVRETFPMIKDPEAEKWFNYISFLAYNKNIL